MASVVATSAHQREHGLAPDPPEATFAQIRDVVAAASTTSRRRGGGKSAGRRRSS